MVQVVGGFCSKSLENRRFFWKGMTEKVINQKSKGGVS